jgi:FMN phosphatase YigB (HAD superfamily)
MRNQPEFDAPKSPTEGWLAILIKHYSDAGFLEAFRVDLAGSIASLSSFLSQNRALHYYPVFHALSLRAVIVDVFTRPLHQQPGESPGPRPTGRKANRVASSMATWTNSQPRPSYAMSWARNCTRRRRVRRDHRPARRCGWFDAVVVRYAVRLNGMSGLALTKLDVLTGLDPIRVCRAYELDGQRFEDFPASCAVLRGLRPVYEDLPGWHAPLNRARARRLARERARLRSPLGRADRGPDGHGVRGRGTKRDHPAEESLRGRPSTALTPHLPAPLSTILFDVGNTLCHLDHAFIAAALTRRGFSVSAHDVAVAEYAAKAAIDARMRAQHGGTDAGRRLSYFEIIFETLGASDTIAAPVAELQAEDARQSLSRVMQPDTPRVIATLRRRGFTLGVVSNADGRVPAGLAAQGIADEFTTIIDSHLLGVEKPDARIFHIALNGCNVHPAESVYVGDIYVDRRPRRAQRRHGGDPPRPARSISRRDRLSAHRHAGAVARRVAGTPGAGRMRSIR